MGLVRRAPVVGLLALLPLALLLLALGLLSLLALALLRGLVRLVGVVHGCFLHAVATTTIGAAASSNAPFCQLVARLDIPAPLLALPLFGRASQRARWARVDVVKSRRGGAAMNSIIYLVGAVVIVAAILSFLGFR